jgi:secondary thiamine-phosphate synthase enzyme
VGRTVRQQTRQFEVQTRGPGAVSIAAPVADWLRTTGIVTGLLTLHVQHTSASLLVQENADPEVMRDLERFFQRIAPYGDALFQHDDEGPDDMPAHVRTALTQTSVSIPVLDGKLALGTWQGIYLYEHRSRPHTRRIVAHVFGE